MRAGRKNPSDAVAVEDSRALNRPCIKKHPWIIHRTQCKRDSFILFSLGHLQFFLSPYAVVLFETYTPMANTVNVCQIVLSLYFLFIFFLLYYFLFLKSTLRKKLCSWKYMLLQKYGTHASLFNVHIGIIIYIVYGNWSGPFIEFTSGFGCIELDASLPSWDLVIQSRCDC